MRIIFNRKPKASAQKTDATLTTQGYSYNQAGFSYNQAGWQYGGKYGTDRLSSPAIIFNKKPSLIVQRTNKTITNQGYSYNQAGFSYNQAGWQYGGVYQNDIVPMVGKARIEKSHIVLSGDIHTNIAPPAPLSQGMLVGMLGMTYPA